MNYATLLVAGVMLATASPAGAADYQMRVPGLCDAGLCRAFLARVPAGKTLRARQASCSLTVAVNLGEELRLSGSAIIAGSATSGVMVSEMLPLVSQSQLRNGFTLATVMSLAANESIALTATGGQEVQALISIDPAQVQSLECSLSGTLS